MKKTTFRNIALALSCTFLLGACQKEYQQETLPNYKMSGEWFVRTYVGSISDTSLALDYSKIVTSNTAAANGNEIVIDDLENIFGLVVKCPANSGNKTFSGQSLLNTYDSTQVNIIDGDVVADAITTQGSGTVVDSIYFIVQYVGDPTQYICAGHYRTGFPEDEY